MRQPNHETVTRVLEVPSANKGKLHKFLEGSPWLGLSLVFHLLLGLAALLLANTPQVQGALSKMILVATPKKENVADRMKDFLPPDAIERDYDSAEPEAPKSEKELEENPVSDISKDGSDGDLGDVSFADMFGLGPGASSGGLGDERSKLRNGPGNEATRETEKAVYDALSWLKRHQSPDGHWDIANFMNNGDSNKPLATGPGNTTSGNIGVTSLALLAYLGGGYDTERNTEFRNTVWAGLNWLFDQQSRRDNKRWESLHVSSFGLFAERDEDGNELWDSHSMYSHMLASLAVSEAYACNRMPLYKRSAQAAIDFIEVCQTPHPRNPDAKYGWRYHPKEAECDSSVTGWAFMALKSAKDAQLRVSNEALLGAKHMLEDLTSKASGRTGYILGDGPGGPSAHPEEKNNPLPARTECCTAIAAFCRFYLPEKGGDFKKPFTPKSQSQMLAAGILKDDLPTWDTRALTVDYYYWYYGTLAMFQMGGQNWEVWNNRLKKVLLPEQNQDENNPNFHGSWDPKPDKWGERGGRVYATALNCLTLEVYYRYPQVFGASK